MEEKLAYICYLDDDDDIKNKYIIIIEESLHYIKFKFSDGAKEISIPWHRIRKLKKDVKQNA